MLGGVVLQNPGSHLNIKPESVQSLRYLQSSQMFFHSYFERTGIRPFLVSVSCDVITLISAALILGVFLISKTSYVQSCPLINDIISIYSYSKGNILSCCISFSCRSFRENFQIPPLSNCNLLFLPKSSRNKVLGLVLFKNCQAKSFGFNPRAYKGFS